MLRLSWIASAVLAAVVATGCAKTDPGITTAVKGKFAADDTVKAYQINVDTANHVVTLTGSVDSSEARERAVQLARNTDGVTSVVNNLVISPAATSTTGVDDRAQAGASGVVDRAGDAIKEGGAILTDAAITAAVKGKFLADPEVSAWKINVDTKDGVVTLTGTLPASAERQRAMALARDTTGVRSVVDQLKVRN